MNINPYERTVLVLKFTHKDKEHIYDAYPKSAQNVCYTKANLLVKLFPKITIEEWTDSNLIGSTQLVEAP